MAVTEISTVVAFDETVKGAGNKVVVVDYSTTWCGPCKMVRSCTENFFKV
jgi:thioredoxin 1